VTRTARFLASIRTKKEKRNKEKIRKYSSRFSVRTGHEKYIFSSKYNQKALSGALWRKKNFENKRKAAARQEALKTMAVDN
jgi:hypothetical protein